MFITISYHCCQNAKNNEKKKGKNFVLPHGNGGRKGLKEYTILKKLHAALIVQYNFTILTTKLLTTFIVCLPPSVDFPLIIAFPILDVYPAGQTVTFICAAGFTLSGSATTSCSGTTLMFDDLTATCLPS